MRCNYQSFLFHAASLIARTGPKSPPVTYLQLRKGLRWSASRGRSLRAARTYCRCCWLRRTTDRPDLLLPFSTVQSRVVRLWHREKINRAFRLFGRLRLQARRFEIAVNEVSRRCYIDTTGGPTAHSSRAAILDPAEQVLFFWLILVRPFGRRRASLIVLVGPAF